MRELAAREQGLADAEQRVGGAALVVQVLQDRQRGPQPGERLRQLTGEPVQGAELGEHPRLAVAVPQFPGHPQRRCQPSRRFRPLAQLQVRGAERVVHLRLAAPVPDRDQAVERPPVVPQRLARPVPHPRQRAEPGDRERFATALAQPGEQLRGPGQGHGRFGVLVVVEVHLPEPAQQRGLAEPVPCRADRVQRPQVTAPPVVVVPAQVVERHGRRRELPGQLRQARVRGELDRPAQHRAVAREPAERFGHHLPFRFRWQGPADGLPAQGAERGRQGLRGPLRQ